MSENKIRLTYFTPTYNRAYIIGKLYQSLCKQTNKNFVWLVIDDGSTDDTKSLFDVWEKEKKINIKYIKKENGGKHTTIDLSNEVCDTEFITCIDSDDYITDNATEVLYSKFDLCASNNIVGLVGPKFISNSKTSENWTLENTEVYFYELDKHLGVIPETTLVFKTEIAKKFKFPEIKGERFITESVYYKQFFYDYKFITFKQCIYNAEYIEDGYTNQGMKLFIKNPKGYACALKINAYYNIKNKISFKNKIKRTMMYYGWKKLFKIKKNFMPKYNLPWFYRFLGLVTSPLSKLVWKRRLKDEK